ncbi:amidase family protein [Ascidiimonas sp. W6]|uniref:amidase family protein n=1 Tax=Ascidiimonas meishanensis TaxID=3128903 RepID=UPI0030ED1645
MNYFKYLLLVLLLVACKQESKIVEDPVVWSSYDETEELEEQETHEIARMRFKLLNSKFVDKNLFWKPFETALSAFGNEKYESLKASILEKNIPELQKQIKDGTLTYEELILFYLYRIRKYESDNTSSLNAIIALNPDVLKQAKEKDENIQDVDLYSMYGMPVLLKDNIGALGMPTTAGAFVLKDNYTEDAFITSKIKESGALILGKVNLSEWAYYFCSGCPLGYSAVGGQTLNPYGRKKFETGGSSSGSGVAVAANYAVVAVGTETAGSILSPSSQNSVVGLKPTIGLLSRSGIVPISSTLDTPGPMTKSVVDNAIFLNAMLGKDKTDAASIETNKDYLENLLKASLKGKKMGVLKPLLENKIYSETIEKLKIEGVEIVEFEPEDIQLEGFLTLLNIDMKYDLPKYFRTYAKDNIKVESIEDVVMFNLKDSLVRAPYGQQLFQGIVKDSTTLEELEKIKQNLEEDARKFFDRVMDTYQLDAVLSINNYHAAYAAVAKYPCLTVPMGYKESGEPISLTFIGKPFTEEHLLKLGYAFENATKVRKSPKNYK